MRIGNIEVNNPLVLGPMAGVTDWAFRTICAELGADITVTEMVSSRALVYKDKKTAALLRRNEGSICGAQIFGNDPEIMAQGAQLALEISGCDFIDINMGCPMPKIAGSGDGCGLMRTPELAGDILAAVVKAVDVPVTVKCRLGLLSSDCRANRPHLGLCPEANVPLQGRQGSGGCIPDAPGETGIHLGAQTPRGSPHSTSTCL